MENSPQNAISPTRWYHYLLAFFFGIFAINMVPHYIEGITGNPFPTPFSDPPGRAPSSPTINVVWALINFVISFAIFYFAKLGQKKKSIWIAAFIGAVLISLQLASHMGAWRAGAFH